MQPLRLLTIPQAADALQLSTRTVYRMIADREVATVQARGKTRISEDEIAAYAKRNSEPAR